MRKYLFKLLVLLCFNLTGALNVLASDYNFENLEESNEVYSAWEVNISGSLNTGLYYSSLGENTYSWNDNNNNNIIDAGETTHVNNSNMLFKTDSELRIDAEYFFNNGMTVSAHTYIDTDDVSIIKNFININGGLAYLEFGINNSVIDQFKVKSNNNGLGLVKFDEMFFLGVSANSINSRHDLTSVAGRSAANADLDRETDHFANADDLLITSSSISPTSKALKVTTLSDVYSGFRFGASYSPTTDTSINGATNNVNSDDPDIWVDNIELAAQFSREVYGYGLSMSGAYYTAKSAADDLDNIKHSKKGYSINSKLNISGFDIVGSYGIINEKYKDSNINSNSYKIKNEIIELTTNYKFDRMVAGIGYLNTKSEKKNNDGDLTAQGEYKHIAAGLSYDMSEGFVIGLEGAYESYKETDYNDVNIAGDDDKNKVSGYVIGSYISTYF